jgi:hypothetical protein
MRRLQIGRGLAAAIAAAALLAPLPASAASARPPGFARGRIAQGSRTAITVIGSGFAVARLELGGGPDPSFGHAGIARTAFPGFREAHSVDGFVRATGTVTIGGYVTERCEPSRGRVCGTHPALAGFTSSGRLDRSFGHDGRVVLGGRPGTVRTVAKLIGGGVAIGGRTRSGLPFVAELRRDGSPERGFGSRGIKIFRSIPGAGRIAKGRVDRIAELPRANGLVASFSATGPNLRRSGLVEVGHRGEIARDFGEGGFVTSLPAGVDFDEYGFGFTALPGKRVLLAATTTAWSPRRPVTVRLLPDGSPDPAYGTGGVAVGPDCDVRFNVDLAPLPAGGAILGMAGFQGADAARVGALGETDPAFGSGGLAPAIETWGSHASVTVLSDGGSALADANRQLSGLVVARYGPAGDLLYTTELAG